MPNLNVALRNRIAELPRFPIGSTIEWKYAAEKMIVTGHDTKNGKVLTAQGGYSPEELELLKK